MRTGLQAILDDLAAIAGESLVVADARAPDQPVVYVNPQFERLCGWPANAMLGRNCRMLQGDDFDQPARWQMREAIREARPMRGMVRNYDRRGRAFINEMTVLPLGGTPGEPECFAGFLRDVSSLAERRDDTQPMLPEARRQQGLEALVHKQPLAADQTPWLAHWLQVAATPADRILGGVLDEHLETESQWREPHSFTPDHLLSQIRRRAQRAAPWLRLQVMREPRFPERIHGVRQVLTDVLAGVLGLLCRFHPVPEARVDMHLQRYPEGGMAPVLRVRPSVTGWGDTDPPSSDGGLAWGALGAMSFVEVAREARLGGAELSVDADFTFTLRLDQPVPMPDVNGSPAREEAPSLKVLVVEDAADTRLMLTEFLRRDGFHVVAAEDGDKALQHLEHSVPDLILMDCVMPGMDGLEACRRIKQQDVFTDLPVLIITALNDEASAGEAIRAGATDFITKPIFLPVLGQRLRQMALSRERQQRITYLAYHDALTGLPNRTSFNDGLNGLLDDARSHGVEHALVYLDLDQFKIVNDTCGHGAGDELLARLGGVLADQVREGDMVARLGGDEFGVLLCNCRLDDAVGVAEKLVEAARNYVFVWQDQTFFVGASAGLVAVTADGAGAEDLLSAADTACYSAKSSGRDRVQVYRHEGGQVLWESEQLQLVPRINRALEEDRFALYRQQIVPLVPETDEMPHYEVLVRMLGETGELIAPGSFIAAAERYQVMPRVDRWVVRRALQGIREAHLDRGQPARYSLNLSGTTLGEKGFADFLETVVRDTGVPPELLCFEITETATIRRLETAVDFIERIRALGCSFALDDFGAGLSSFGYLKTLPVDYIKIDGRFVRELLVDTFDQAMVEAMQRIGSVMGIETIAEFVEDEAVIDRLREIGVRYAQGFGIHRPEPFI